MSKDVVIRRLTVGDDNEITEVTTVHPKKGAREYTPKEACEALGDVDFFLWQRFPTIFDVWEKGEVEPYLLLADDDQLADHFPDGSEVMISPVEYPCALRVRNCQ